MFTLFSIVNVTMLGDAVSLYLMALPWKCHCLLAVLCASFVGVGADCDQECAYCAYHLAGHATEFNSLSCTLECEGKTSSGKAWGMCKELEEINKLHEDSQSAPENDKEKEEQHQLLNKRYGGFMKRYGGFMKKGDPSDTYFANVHDENRGREILNKRYGGFMKKDVESASSVDSSDILKELLNLSELNDQKHYLDHGDSDGRSDIMKRYGGFMNAFKQNQELDEWPELQKRYGGFMRRFGKPDYQKRYGGFMKRWNDALVPSDEDGEIYSKEVPEFEKRYGGFMRN
ncbi:proenkephalin b isoform X1 [Hypanus sabinus]|uniref:proenkephalin b isoform X1 n=2 Tax=Hypanus sabinus TaxID=79690 RepID=UPI0028C49CCC|nr:proenkephalin b isoform X1 [Hypanus sabinus]